MIVRISEIPDEGLQVDSLADLGAAFPEAGWTLRAGAPRGGPPPRARARRPSREGRAGPGRPRAGLLPGRHARRRGAAAERDGPGPADEAALPRRLPGALPGVRREPERHGLRLRGAERRSPPRAPGGAP